MAKSKFSGSMTAEELMAKLNADPEWVAANKEREKRWADLARQLSENEAPIIRDLVDAGIEVDSVDELSDPHPRAIPILLDHLRRFHAYDQRIRGSVAYALATAEARSYIPELLSIYRQDPDTSLNDGKGAIASTICELADESFTSEIAALALDQGHGDARAPLVDFLGQFRSEVAKTTLEKLIDDPFIDVSLRAKSALKKMSRQQSKGAVKHKRKDYKLIANSPATFGRRNDSSSNEGSVEFNRPFLMRKVHRRFLESSGSFDGDKLPEFLRLVERAGLIQEVVSNAVLTELTELDISEERLLEFKVEFKGRMIPLQVLLYLEDTDAPSVYFFSTHDLTSAIDRVMGEWMDAE